jgi:hypothetical protein
MRIISSQGQSIDGEIIWVFAETKTAFQIRDQSMGRGVEGREKNIWRRRDAGKEKTKKTKKKKKRVKFKKDK